MPRKQLNIRISDDTRRKLQWLRVDDGESEGEIIAKAIDQLYERRMVRYEHPDPITQDFIDEAQADEGEREDYEKQHANDVRGYDYESNKD